MSALATIDHSRSQLATRPILSREMITIEQEQRAIIGEYVQSQMIEGVDFGTIPGTKKKSLYKPGAEKLTSLFHCMPRFTILEQTEDFKAGFFYYKFKCEIETMQGAVVSEGFGSCNSLESRYRYRNDERKCPECGKPAIRKSKFAPRDRPNDPPGFYCHDKQGGCGANFQHDDESIIHQVVGKIENPDRADVANTCLKMGKKRALVDAALSLSRCSDLFTQDVEDDLPDGSNGADGPPPSQNGAKGKNGQSAPRVDAKQSAKDSAEMVKGIKDWKGDPSKFWANLEPHLGNLTPQDRDTVMAAWSAKYPPSSGSVSSPDATSSAQLADVMIKSTNGCKSLDDLDTFGKMAAQNLPKLTAADKQRVIDAGKLRRDILAQEAKARDEFGPGATEDGE